MADQLLPDGRVYRFDDGAGVWRHIPDVDTANAMGVDWGNLDLVDDQPDPAGADWPSVAGGAPAGYNDELLPDGRVYRYDAAGGVWRHIPDPATAAAMAVDWGAIDLVADQPEPTGSDWPSVNAGQIGPATGEVVLGELPVLDGEIELTMFDSTTQSVPGWIASLIVNLKGKVTTNAVNALTLWARSEGTPASWNNPLASTDAYNGSRSVNSAGVQAYRSLADAVHVYLLKLRSSTYRDIGDGLKGGVSLSDMYVLINISPWCHGCQGGHYPNALYSQVHGLLPPLPSTLGPPAPPAIAPPPEVVPATPVVPDTPDAPGAPDAPERVVGAFNELTHSLAHTCADDCVAALRISDQFLDAVR